MDRTERLISNRALYRIILSGLCMLPLAAAAAWLIAGGLADSILARELHTLLMLTDGSPVPLGSYGYTADMSVRLLPDYMPVRRSIFTVLFCFSAVCILLAVWLAYRHADRVYADLDQLYADCMCLADDLNGRMTPRGSEIGSIRRVCEGIQRVADRTRHIADRLDRSKHQLKDLLYDVSHQLKTSLAVVRLNRDMLDELPLPEHERSRLSQEITLHLDGMETLVLEMLKYAKLNADAVQYDFSETDLPETCRLAVGRVQPLLRAKQITASVVVTEDAPVSMPHDRTWLCEAVENLLKNAADHADCTAVTVELTALPAAVRMRIFDNGSGIPLSEIPHLFDRFRKRDVTPETQCTGIGMAIAKQIFSVHGGEITVYSDRRGTELLTLFLGAA